VGEPRAAVPRTVRDDHAALLRRGEPRYARAVRTLDGLVALAQRHRAAVVVPRLQPTVKWPANEPPQIDWGDYDSLVGRG
jgi:hypothetical protein